MTIKAEKFAGIVLQVLPFPELHQESSQIQHRKIILGKEMPDWLFLEKDEFHSH